MIPHPWYAKRVQGEYSSLCFANKSIGEKCCDYKKTDEPECVARFQGYGSDSARGWMKSCRSPAWSDGGTVTTQPEQPMQPGARFEEERPAGQDACEIAGIYVPAPWHRLPDTPKLQCVAPKQRLDGMREKCCDYSKRDPMCEAIFEGYSAQDMAGWISHCRMPHWGTGRRAR